MGFEITFEGALLFYLYMHFNEIFFTKYSRNNLYIISRLKKYLVKMQSHNSKNPPSENVQPVLSYYYFYGF